MSLFGIFAGVKWNRVERGLAPVIQVLFLYGIYWLGLRTVFNLPAPERFIDMNVAHTQMRVIDTILLVAVGLLMLGFFLRRRAPDSLLYQHLGAQFFALTLVWAGYITGTQSFATGVVLIGAALAGYIALERRVIFMGVAVSFVLLLIMNIGAAYDLLPYGPLLRAPYDHDSLMFWTHASLFLAAPNVLMYFAVIAIMLSYWRRREALALKLSLTDELTTLHNRRSILSHVRKEIARTRRHGPSLAVVILDLDGFKQINDRWGHPVGDRVLKAAADALRSNIRQCDLVGRFGGEEFLLLLPDTNSTGAAAMMERCRKALEKLVLHSDSGELIPVRGSFGIACNENRLDVNSETLISAADQALYHAKESGRNRIELANLEDISMIPDTELASGREHDRPAARRLLDELIKGGPFWTPVMKHALAGGLATIQLFMYSSWGLLLLLFPNRDALINVDGVLTVLPYAATLLLLMAALTGIGPLINRRWKESKLYGHLLQNTYSLAMIFFGYLVGMISLPVGIILIGAPLIGLVFFERAYVFLATASSLVALVALTYASALGAIPYAPILPTDIGIHSSVTPLWLMAFYLFFVPHMVVVVYLADRTFGHWRERGQEVRELSRTDPLTHIHNRRSLIALLDKELARTLRHGPPLAVVMLDMDHFKRINDSRGHPFGDKVLKRAAEVLVETVRECDAVGRYGGEEFILLLPDTTLEGARVLAERCRAAIAAQTITAEDGSVVRLSASFGLTCNEHCLTLDRDALIRAADHALYEAKEAGRNCVRETLASAPTQTMQTA